MNTQKGNLNVNDIKMIALDIDGTLITSSQILTPRTKKALNDAMNAGIYVTLATGRFYRSTLRLAKTLPVNAPIITNDGALIRNISDGKTIFYKPLPMDISLEILDLASEYDSLRIQVFLKDDKIFIGNNYYLHQLGRFFKFSKVFRSLNLKGCYYYLKDFVFLPVQNSGNVESAKEMMNEPPVKLVITGESDELQHLSDKLIKEYGNEIFLTSALRNCIDILDGSVSKAKGLEVLAENLNIKREQIIAVGDNINDIPMLKYAGFSVAMGNAPDTVKKKADFVTGTNNEDGIAMFVEKLLDKNGNNSETYTTGKDIPFNV